MSKKEDSRTLFRRLTSLFKSGPNIRRKVRGLDTVTAKPDPSKASGALLFQKSLSPTYANITGNVYNLAERLMRYQDFQEMQYTPEIASACDIYADESCSVDDKGRVLHVFSENEKVREVLENLFYNIVNVEFNLRSWTRNLVVYGDLFTLNNVSPTHGILNVVPMPVNEVEREEGYDRDDPFAVRFKWVSLGNRTLENWEVSHFRLLGQDSFLPYGSSIIEPARRIWRQLILIEDAMLVYRVTRAPERRVFYIDVANLPPEEVPAYVEEQRARLRTNQVVDKTTHRIDLRYNPLCFQASTKIPLLDGRTVAIKELAAEWASGKRDQEVYSLDLEQGGRVVPGRIEWVGSSGITKQLARVFLDDGGIIEVTPDHKMMRRNGDPVKASDLLPGDSLMPMYARLATMDGKKTEENCEQNAYEQVLDPASGTYYFTHRLVMAAKKNLKVYGNGFIEQQGFVIHHQNHRKRDNSSNNLELMTVSDHQRHHAEIGKKHIIRYNKSEKKKKRVSQCNKERNSVAAMSWYNNSDLHKEHNVQRSKAMSSMWKNPKKRAKAQANMSYKWSQECQEIVVKQIKELSEFEGLDAFLRRLKEHDVFVDVYSRVNEHLGRDPKKSLHKNVVGKFITKDYKNWKSLWVAHNPRALGRKFVNNVDVNRVAKEGQNNHKVLHVEIVDVDEEVFNLTIDKYHNLTIQASNCEMLNMGKVQSFQSVEEDFFIPVRGGETGTKIETLPGGQNVAAVEDVAYVQRKLIAALKVPRAYLGYEDALSSKATLSQQDIRFSRTVSVIQRTMLAELNKMAIVHLYALGFRDSDLVDFTLRMSNPSTVAQQQKLELWRAKFEIAGSVPEGMGSKRFVYKNVWDLSDQDIEELEDERREDRIKDAELEAIAAGESGGGGGGGGGGIDLLGGDSGGDVGGGDVGAELDAAASGGGEAPTPEEPAGEENAGEEPEEEEGAGVELLTSGDEVDGFELDEEDSPPTPEARDKKRPVRAQPTPLQHALYNRARRRHHGAASTHTPDFKKMASNDTRYDRDVYDTDFLKRSVSDPLGEGTVPVKLTGDVASALRRMSGLAVFSSVTGDSRILTEGTDVQAKVDSALKEEFGIDVEWDDVADTYEDEG